MLLRILGTAAGGGVPQWNCACPGCSGARRFPSRRRLHDGLALHGARPDEWFLVNATPDIAEQLESHSDLRPADEHARTPVVRAVLTDAELDHTLGLLRLREAARIEVWCTRPVRAALEHRLNLTDVLAPYTGLVWNELPSGDARQPARIAGLDVSGVELSAKRPRYAADDDAHPAWSVGLRVHDTRSGRRLLYAPAVATWSDALEQALAGTDCALLDGTFLDEDEPRRTGISSRTATGMGHLPILGPAGTAHRLRGTGAHIYYTHLNNTNPLVDPDAPEHTRLAEAELNVAHDRMVREL
ncbi:pyrroloquinoline quinone biosynthesis protein PqqB [Streptomyces sp. NPDC102360]|uniref:pyrroloquinoline quinone biosynthesis protein PqqB n=1 Tax=Streptomyces sp. NPDC102360 TaxID=3366160 RepID=UPI0038053374